ncbi:MAG TPA: hypothetical protein VN282_25815 [Pyrinomonadaceae bacterium]|nr:hypothetical protein [Pyrinomonadaceae bacterium]
MPMSVGLARWSDLTEEMLAAVREHAAWKAAEPVNWDAPAPEDFYTAAYHYIEVGLIDVLADGINQGLPVRIYP